MGNVSLSHAEIVENIMVTAICFFSMGTEIRYHYDNPGPIHLDFTCHHGQVIHEISIQTLMPLVPHDCPIITHLVDSYRQNYSLKSVESVHVGTCE